MPRASLNLVHVEHPLRVPPRLASMVASVQTIVLVHAFGSGGRAWAPQVAGLGDRYRAIAPDLPCHGVAAGLPG